MPCEKGSSMVRRFSIPPLHRQRLSSPLWSVTPSNFLLCSHHRHPFLGGKKEGAEEGGLCDYLGVKHRMWVTKGEFFEPTSFQSTICAWTVKEFKQRRQTKHRYREVHAGFTKIHTITRRDSEGVSQLSVLLQNWIWTKWSVKAYCNNWKICKKNERKHR